MMVKGMEGNTVVGKNFVQITIGYQNQLRWGWTLRPGMWALSVFTTTLDNDIIQLCCMIYFICLKFIVLVVLFQLHHFLY